MLICKAIAPEKCAKLGVNCLVCIHLDTLLLESMSCSCQLFVICFSGWHRYDLQPCISSDAIQWIGLQWMLPEQVHDFVCR